MLTKLSLKAEHCVCERGDRSHHSSMRTDINHLCITEENQNETGQQAWLWTRPPMKHLSCDLHGVCLPKDGEPRSQDTSPSGIQLQPNQSREARYPRHVPLACSLLILSLEIHGTASLVLIIFGMPQLKKSVVGAGLCERWTDILYYPSWNQVNWWCSPKPHGHSWVLSPRPPISISLAGSLRMA